MLRILSNRPSEIVFSEKAIPCGEPVERLVFSRLIKNAQMQGARNPEE